VRGSISSDDTTIELKNNTSLIIDGANIESADSNAVLNHSNSNGNITLISGVVRSESEVIYAIQSNSQNGSIDIIGGTVCGKLSAVAGYNIHISGGTISGKAVTVVGFNVHISGGRIERTNGPAVVCVYGENTISGGTITADNSIINIDRSREIFPGTVLLLNQFDDIYYKLIVSGGSIINTASQGYAICVYNLQRGGMTYQNNLVLTGNPTISSPVDIWTNTVIYADGGAKPGSAPYTGDALTINYSDDDLQAGIAAVSFVTVGTNDEKFSITNDGNCLLVRGTDLIICNTN